MGPLDLAKYGGFGVAASSLAIGVAFGFILERAGFGDSRKLSAQFYLKDQSVIKVMFTAIVVAATLIFWSSGIGILDFDRVWVNPTYFWSGLIGGILLGMGFIIGGYCPGTSVVAASTLKLDGFVFFLGCLLGIFLFGETVSYFHAFWEHAGFLGRLTIPERLGLSDGIVVLGVIVIAVIVFSGVEFIEAWMNRSGKPNRAGIEDSRIEGASGIAPRRSSLPRLAAGLLTAGIGLAVVSQVVPNPALERARKRAEALIASRERHIECAELLSLMQNNQIVLNLIDVRDESNWNLFHLADAKREPLAAIDPAWIKKLSADSIKVVMSNDEEAANQAAVKLIAHGARNVYILEGGINKWIAVYGKGEIEAISASSAADSLRYRFAAALGSHYAAADPDPWNTPIPKFTPKVKFEKPVVKISGGCGG